MLSQSSECRKIDYIYNYETIAKCCHKIIKTVEKNITNEEKSPLTDEDKLTIKELCLCLSRMLLNISTLNWNSLAMEEVDIQTEKPARVNKFSLSPVQLEECLLRANLICMENLVLKILPF